VTTGAGTSLARRYGLFAVVVLAGVVLDQITKAWAEAALGSRELIVVIDGYFELVLARNRGAFFSLGEHLPDSVRVAFFVLAAVVAIAVMLRLFAATQPSQRALRWALMLLCSGAIGNMIDRARRGSVVDFLHMHLREVFHWATFNVADIWITAGLLLLLADLAKSKPAPPAG
jgi:signal peptidase II